MLGGVFHAAVLFLVAAGLQLVFGVQKLLNLACGSFYALGAYFGVSAVQWYVSAGGPPAFFIVPLIAAGALIGVTGAPVGVRLRLSSRRSSPSASRRKASSPASSR